MKHETPNKLDFVVVGSRKCATTWLYELFLLHDEICVSKQVKQSGFFPKHFHKGKRWYFKHFDEYVLGQLVGEVDPDIISSEGSIERVFQFAPKAKIIVIFRNPADLFYSSYEHAFRKGDVSETPEASWEKYPRFYNELRYGTMLEEIYNIYPKEQVLVLNYEDILNNSKSALEDISQFLSICSTFDPVLIQNRVNASRTARFPFLTKCLARLARIARKLGLHSTVIFAKRLCTNTETITNRNIVDVARSGSLRNTIHRALEEEMELFRVHAPLEKSSWKSESD